MAGKSARTARMRRHTAALACLLATGCVHDSPAATTATTTATSCPPVAAASTPAPVVPTLPTFDPGAFLCDLAAQANTPLRAPSAPIAALEEERRGSRSADARRSASRDLALAHLSAAEAATDETSRARHFAAASREARSALRGNRNEERASEMAFVEMWRAYRLASSDAEQLANAFEQTYGNHTEVLPIVRMVRGELAIASGRYADARTAFRTALVDPASPLFAFALYRTATVHRLEGRIPEAFDMLRFVAQLGCRPDAPTATLGLAVRAWLETGAQVAAPAARIDADRPWCTVGSRPEPTP